MSASLIPTVVLSWTIPTPRGLWYQAFVFVDRGVFLTDRVDIATLKRIQRASQDGTAATVKELTEHGRFKRPMFVPYADVKGLRTNLTGGTIELETANEPLKANVPNRERLELLAQEFRSASTVFSVHTGGASRPAVN